MFRHQSHACEDATVRAVGAAAAAAGRSARRANSVIDVHIKEMPRHVKHQFKGIGGVATVRDPLPKAIAFPGRAANM